VVCVPAPAGIAVTVTTYVPAVVPVCVVLVTGLDEPPHPTRLPKETRSIIASKPGSLRRRRDGTQKNRPIANTVPAIPRRNGVWSIPVVRGVDPILSTAVAAVPPLIVTDPGATVQVIGSIAFAGCVVTAQDRATEPV